MNRLCSFLLLATAAIAAASSMALGQANLVNNGDFELLELDEFDAPVVNEYGNNVPVSWFHKQTTPGQTGTPAVELIDGDDSNGDGQYSYALNHYSVNVGGIEFPGESDIRSQAIEVVAGETLTWSFDYKLIGVDQGVGDEFRADLRFFEDVNAEDPTSTGSAFIFEDLFFSSEAIVPDDEWQTIVREFVVPFDSPESSDDDGRPAEGTTVYADLRFSVNAFTTFEGGQALFDNISVTRPVTADYNGDGLVNAADYTVWRDTEGSTTELAADGNGDGVVDSADYDRWRAEYGLATAAPASAAASAPEPAAAALVIVASAAFGAGRRRAPSPAGRSH